jgi:hypothetical protein
VGNSGGMEHDQAPRRDDPADPVTATPEEVAASRTRADEGRPGSADPNRKADTTKEAAVEPPD